MELPQPLRGIGAGLCAAWPARRSISATAWWATCRILLQRSRVGGHAGVDELPQPWLARQAPALRHECLPPGGDDYELLFTAADEAAVQRAAARPAWRCAASAAIEAQPGLRGVDVRVGVACAAGLITSPNEATSTMAPPPDPAASALPMTAQGRPGAPTPPIPARASRAVDRPGLRQRLSPWAPGRPEPCGRGARAFLAPWLQRSVGTGCWASAPRGRWWACTRTAQHLGIADPAPSSGTRCSRSGWCCGCWRPRGSGRNWRRLRCSASSMRPNSGPVGWADQAFKLRPGEPIGWRQGFRHPVRRPGGGGVHRGVLMAWRA